MKRREFIAKCGAGLFEITAAGLPMVGGAVPVRSAIGARQIETTDGEESDRPYKRELPWIHSVSGLNYYLVNWPSSTENYQRIRFYFGGNAISEQGWFFAHDGGDQYLHTLKCNKNWGTTWVIGGPTANFFSFPDMNKYAGKVIDIENDNGNLHATVGTDVLVESTCDLRFDNVSAILCRERYTGNYAYSAHCRVGFFQYWCSKNEMFSDCRPVIMKDGQVGYYDLIREQFYPNSGTGVIATP